MADSSKAYGIEHFNVSFPADYVAHVEINRPKKFNAMAPAMWGNLCTTFDKLSRDPDVRCILFSGAGDKAFCSGLDVQAASTEGPVSQPEENADVARRTWAIRRLIIDWQHCVSSIERCEKPVIALLHGFSYGAAVDLVSAADVRYCSNDVRISVKEVDIGLAADVGTLSRLPKIGVPYSWAKEIVYTARVFGADEAARVGFVTRVLKDKNELLEQGLQLAKLIASKSPVAVQSSKALLDYSRDRPIDDGLRFTQAWNASMVQADDVNKAMMRGIQKTTPRFEKL